MRPGIPADERIGSAEDRRRRSVVLLEQDDLAPREVALEVLDVAYVCRPPRVDALVGVADHADVLMGRASFWARRYWTGLVSWNSSTRTCTYRPAYFSSASGDSLNSRNPSIQEVVEVQRVGAIEGAVVRLIGARHDFLGVALYLARILGRNQHRVLGVGDFRKHRARCEAPGVNLQVFQYPLHDAHLVTVVVDHEILRDADPLAIDPQPACAHRVERPEVQFPRPVAEQGCAALSHFAGGLVRECHRQDSVGLDLVFADKVSDAPGDHPRLAASRPGEHEQGAFAPGHGTLLRFVQARKDLVAGVGGSHVGSLTSAYLAQPFAMAPTIADAILEYQRPGTRPGERANVPD